MAIKTPKDDIMILPQEIMPNLKNASAEELKILIYLFARPDALISDAARDLGITLARAESAVAFWRGANIFAESTEKKTVAHDTSMYRNYDKATAAQILTNSPEFKMVYDVALQNMGKSDLTPNEISSLLYLFDFAGMKAPVICGIIADCCDRGKNNMQYIHKTALELYEKGIDTYDKLEEYFAFRNEINSNIGKLRKLCGMGERALTKKEKDMFDCWFGDWRFSFEMVSAAYEKTVDTTGKHSITYMNGILRRWHESGFENMEDVTSGEASRTPGTESSFDSDEFITAALKRGFDD